MERNEVSVHQARIYVAIKNAAGWVTNREIAKSASVAERTARQHTLNLVKLGVLDLAEVFPAHKYRLSEKASKRNAAYVNRLESAREVFAL
jgi:predicted ArsR family transcriptional regulator